jgi:hypothetical protein
MTWSCETVFKEKLDQLSDAETARNKYEEKVERFASGGRG